MKKKIGLFLGCTPEWGGQFQYNLSLLDAFNKLPEDEYEISIAYTEIIWESYLSNLTCDKFYIPFAKLSYLFGILITLFNLPLKIWYKISPLIDPIANKVKKQNCDLWVFSSYSFTSYQMPIKSIGVVHDLMHRYERGFPEISSFRIYYWREKVFKKMCKYCQYIFVDSNLGKNQLMESYDIDNHKIFVMPFVIPDYIYQHNNIQNKKGSLTLPGKFIFYPAQFWKHKNHENLIYAFANVIKKYPNIHLVFTGSKKNYYNKIVTLIHELNIKENVHILGYVSNEEIVDIYRKAHVFIFPSFCGPTNIPPLEALALGCPVSVSDVYAMREQLSEAAIYFNPNSVSEIENSILSLLNDNKLRDSLRIKGYEIVKHYTQEVFNNRFRNTIKTIVSG
ncbi:MAG: glycosyltransferase family 1 protein [Ignavibacteriales bacterium]|nr:glycosyltransferase family 1 protein [Ignavibacteriales bacterium]